MIKIKSLKSFAGAISMGKGQVREVPDSEVVQDLLKAGYAEEVKASEKNPETKKKKGGK